MTGSIGEKPTMLLCQNVPRIFGRSDFVEKRAVARRLQVDAADFHIECVFLRSNDQVGAIAAQFAVDFVADVGGYGDHGGGNGYAQRDRDPRQQLAARLAAKRFVDDARKHFYYFGSK